ncbi:Uncharacterised protein [Vibrio cholerae]|nr:Uncharacterised protein [Vibrio cholerae]
MLFIPAIGTLIFRDGKHPVNVFLNFTVRS